MRDPAVVFDWDGTLRDGLTLLPWAEFLARKGILSPRSEEAINLLSSKHSKGAIAYEPFARDVIACLASGLKGLRASRVAEVAPEFVQRDSLHLFSFVEPTLAFLREGGVKTIVISGCPEEILNAYQPRLGFDLIRGASLAKDPKGSYSGEVRLNPSLAQTKRALISRLAQKYRIMIALGNTTSDWPLLERASFPMYLHEDRSPVDARIANSAQLVSRAEVLPAIREFLNSSHQVQVPALVKR